MSMSIETITVANCAACPFHRFIAPIGFCMTTRSKRDIGQASHLPPPEWCPLRAGDRVVTLRVP